jgi:hypothetical protein
LILGLIRVPFTNSGNRAAWANFSAHLQVLIPDRAACVLFGSCCAVGRKLMMDSIRGSEKLSTLDCDN